MGLKFNPLVFNGLVDSGSSGGGGGGADQALDNLTNPTAINQDLIFSTGSQSSLKTQDVVGVGSSFALVITSGESGNGTGDTSGPVQFSSGDSLGTGVLAASGDVNVQSGTSINGPSGAVAISSGPSSGNSGQISLSTPIPTGEGVQGSVTISTLALDLLGTTAAINFLDPVNPQDAATKAYVDGRILALNSNPSAGGAVSEALTVTGLLTTDTIISVTQSIAGNNVVKTNLPLIGWDTVVTGGLTANWVGDPGAGAVVLVAIQR